MAAQYAAKIKNDYLDFWTVKNPDDIRLFGLALARMRKEKKMSQQELALEADLAKSTIQRIEKGTLVITLDTVYTLAKALDIEPGSFFELDISQ